MCVHTSMFFDVLSRIQYPDSYVFDDEVSRGMYRECHWRHVCDVHTNTWGKFYFHPYGQELGNMRPWVVEPELEQGPHAVAACVIHPGLLQCDAETQTPDIAGFKLAFCMLSHTRLGSASVWLKLPEQLMQMVVNNYTQVFERSFEFY